jgi:hypothetical protein
MLQLIALISYWLVGCGGGAISSSIPSQPSHTSNTSLPVSVSTSPRNATLASGAQQQFTATVSNTPNIAVTWSATAGTVNSSGLFTAPAVSTATAVIVTATSRADTNMSSLANLMVTPSIQAPPPVEHTVALSWKASTNSTVISYSVYRSTISGASYGLLSSAISGETYVDPAVQSGATYYYVVTAVDDQGRESSYSSQAAITIP